jgi:ATP-dependent Clp protease ATP-binding subunit ClpA
MFSMTLEMVLSVAVREALARHHAHLTLEHLLYAVAHDPLGEEILKACGANLDRLREDLRRYLEDEIERLPKG